MRLILLTGCRSGEVRRLRWRDVTRDVTRDRLVLRESKTGPRQVLLGEAARNLLDGLSKPRSGEWVFPGRAPEGHLSEGALYWFWCWVRDEAGSVGNARRHDLRHRFASHAVLQGAPLPVVSRLLGHKRPSMTLRYAHVGDRETEAAAERIGATIAKELDISGSAQAT